MMHSVDDIYNLLPAIYRIRDAERDLPLKALVTLLAEQAGVVESDIAKLHENWFIETCEEWVVPYLGDLLGVRGLHPVNQATFSLRARVANTLAYRRRKGTATMLEQLARDTTGWPARAVEFFELLVATQHINHLRPHSLATPDLRRTDMLDLLNTPFDRIAHTVDVRHIASRRGQHNIPNVGLFLWRLQDYPLTGVTARAVANPPDGRFTFNPLGLDAPLFNSPQPETEITHLAEEINVPGELRRRPLYDELEKRRQALVDQQAVATLYFGTEPVFQIYFNGKKTALDPGKILICDLSNWHIPPGSKTYLRADGQKVQRKIQVAVDPRLGRLTFPQGTAPGEVLVDYACGFSGDVGGGPYDRQHSVQQLRTLDGQAPLLERVAWQAGVTQKTVPGPGLIFSTVTESVKAWNDWSKQNPGQVGVIALMDSRTYAEDLNGANGVTVPEGSQLLLVAGDWPRQKTPAGAFIRANGQLTPTEVRPHLRGSLSITGTAPTTSATPGELIVNGLLVEGRVAVEDGHLGSLRIQHSTIVPNQGGLEAKLANPELIIRLEQSISSKIELGDSVKQLYVDESIVQGDPLPPGKTGPAIQAPGALATLLASTFFGEVSARMIEASNSIFTEKLAATLRQAGCVRFCFVPDNSVTPRRYRCQPDLALKDAIDAVDRKHIIARVQPAFTSTAYGQPGYAQLKLTVPSEIRSSADDGAEMGAFHFLKQPQREANLRASLDEYLRFGLEAGILYAT